MTDNATAVSGRTCVTDASTRSFTLNDELTIPSANPDKQLPPNKPDCSGYAWYPMYVMYHQEMKVQSVLDAHQFRTFIPMEQQSVRRKGIDVVSNVPAIHNLIFVYSSRERITWMKMYNDQCTKMQYMSFRNTTDGLSSVITVPEAQMKNIITAATIEDTQGLRSYIDTPANIDPANPGRQIEFVSGPFKGVTGIIKRVNKNRVMLIELPQAKSIQIKISRTQDINYL